MGQVPLMLRGGRTTLDNKIYASFVKCECSMHVKCGVYSFKRLPFLSCRPVAPPHSFFCSLADLSRAELSKKPTLSI